MTNRLKKLNKKRVTSEKTNKNHIQMYIIKSKVTFLKLFVTVKTLKELIIVNILYNDT